MSSQSDKVHTAALEFLISCSCLFQRGMQREVGRLDVFKHAASSGMSRGELMSSSQNKFSFPKAVDISLGKRDFNPWLFSRSQGDVSSGDPEDKAGPVAHQDQSGRCRLDRAQRCDSGICCCVQLPVCLFCCVHARVTGFTWPPVSWAVPGFAGHARQHL